MIHNLKILPEYFEAVIAGHKKFEIRKDDRNFKVGDTLALLEWDGTKYTGRDVWKTVTYKFSGPGFGIEAGFCVLSML